MAYAGVAHAVMMATPADLEDFATGFSLTEGIAARAADLRAVRIESADDAITLDMTLAPDCLHRFLARNRARSLRGHTSCGICGVRDLADIPPAPRRALAVDPPSSDAIARACEDLRGHQPLAARTHATHAAAWVATDGAIQLVREDVGRHNALDKLIGAVARAGLETGAGFCLITSRCSYEMVQKSLAAGFPALVALSAPTALARRTAADAGLWLHANAARMLRGRQ